MVLEGLAGEGHRRNLAGLTMVALLAAAGATLYASNDPGPAFQQMMMVDGFATFFRVLVIVVGMLAVLCSASYLTRENADAGEYYALISFLSPASA